jgi:3-oxoacyl-[acyl-carrier protein] reductase
MKKVLITGVASGIGLAQAKLFLKKGYQVIGCDKSEMPEPLGETFTFVKLDLTGDLSPLFACTSDLDVLCLTAGVLDDYKPLLDTSDADFEQLFAVNLLAAVKLTRYYLPQMIARKSGVIITMCSIASFIAGGGGAAYTASKHALAGFTKQLALDYARTGVQIFGIAPGAIKTAMTQKDFDDNGGQMADWVANETPLGRWAEPSEVAELTAFLASGKASYMHGEIVKIDGGWTLK